MMNRTVKACILAAAGFLLAVAGLTLIKTITDPSGVMKALPYVCMGIGCGVFGHGMGSLIDARAVKNRPDLQKQIEIDQNDERNLAIASRAKAKAYDAMIFVYGALLLSCALMGTDMTVILLMALAYLIVVFYGVYYRWRFDKEM